MIREGDNLEVVVIEGNQTIAQQLMGLLASAGFTPHVLAPDRALMAAPGWTGPEVLLIGLDAERPQRLAYARRVQGAYPSAIIIGYTSNYTADALGEAMSAGARRVLRYPFEISALRQAVNDVREEVRLLTGPIASAPTAQVAPRPVSPISTAVATLNPERPHQLIALFSPKGGVGTSTLAVNLALALQLTGNQAVLVDGNISFGSLEVFLELQPVRSILQLVGDVEQMTPEAVMETLVPHSTGLQVLLAPLRPEEGDSIRGEHMQRVLNILKQRFPFTLVDTWPSYDERVLAVLEIADIILVPIGPDLPAMKNLNSFLRVARLLNYDMDKIVPVLMRANSVPPGHLKDLETFLKQELKWRVVSDGKRATAAANTGTPFVLSARDSQISQNIFDLAKSLAGDHEPAEDQAAKAKPQTGGRFWKR
jgi:pilus assembly protein CpaE